jgi:hypothetical protein
VKCTLKAARRLPELTLAELSPALLPLTEIIDPHPSHLLAMAGVSTPSLKSRNWKAVYVLLSMHAYLGGELNCTAIQSHTVGLPFALAFAKKGLSLGLLSEHAAIRLDMQPMASNCIQLRNRFDITSSSLPAGWKSITHYINQHRASSVQGGKLGNKCYGCMRTELRMSEFRSPMSTIRTSELLYA